MLLVNDRQQSLTNNLLQTQACTDMLSLDNNATVAFILTQSRHLFLHDDTNKALPWLQFFVYIALLSLAAKGGNCAPLPPTHHVLSSDTRPMRSRQRQYKQCTQPTTTPQYSHDYWIQIGVKFVQLQSPSLASSLCSTQDDVRISRASSGMHLTAAHIVWTQRYYRCTTPPLGTLLLHLPPVYLHIREG